MNNKKWILISVLLLSVLLTSNPVYPGDPDSLRGIKGVYVAIEYLPPEIEGKLTREQIRTDVELKLRMAGINVVSTPREMVNIPGWPCLYVNVNAMTRQNGLVVYGVRIELQQRVYLERDPKISIKATTWSVSKIGYAGMDFIQNIRMSIKDSVDTFINEYLSVNPKVGK